MKKRDYNRKREKIVTQFNFIINPYHIKMLQHSVHIPLENKCIQREKRVRQARPSQTTSRLQLTTMDNVMGHTYTPPAVDEKYKKYNER